MHAFLAFAAAAASLALADGTTDSSSVGIDISKIPQCALQCIVASAGSTSCSVTDTYCLCTTGAEDIVKSLIPCVCESTCTPDEVTGEYRDPSVIRALQQQHNPYAFVVTGDLKSRADDVTCRNPQNFQRHLRRSLCRQGREIRPSISRSPTLPKGRGRSTTHSRFRTSVEHVDWHRSRSSTIQLACWICCKHRFDSFRHVQERYEHDGLGDGQHDQYYVGYGIHGNRNTEHRWRCKRRGGYEDGGHSASHWIGGSCFGDLVGQPRYSDLHIQYLLKVIIVWKDCSSEQRNFCNHHWAGSFTQQELRPTCLATQ